MLSCCRVQTRFQLSASTSSSSPAANAPVVPNSLFLLAPNRRNSAAIGAAFRRPSVVVATAPPLVQDAGGLPAFPTSPELGLLSLLFVLTMAIGSFFSVAIVSIPTLNTLRKMATSVDSLRKVMSEEVPGTLTALKLSSLEINELTQQLSSLRRRISGSKHASDRPNKPTRNGKRPNAGGLQ